MASGKSWVLTDVTRGVWVDNLELPAAALGLGAKSGARISKCTLRGGLQDGVDLVEIRNGPLSVWVLPTRGLGIWRAAYKGLPIAWQAPVRGPVHPKFVNLNERAGLGWLQGFDELLVRCGLASNGPPGVDVLADNTGKPVEMPLTLHGRIANQPAYRVQVGVRAAGDTMEVFVRGSVEESMLFGPKFRLDVDIAARLGGDAFTVTDRVTNLGATEAEMQILYHWNIGAPLLQKGARAAVPARARGPFNAHAAKDVDRWDVYRAPTPGMVEQVYWHAPIADRQGNTLAMLKNAAGNKGVALRFNTKQLPCMTQWKCTSGASEGYVTGLEPATNYPLAKVFERKQGRVVTMKPGATYRIDSVLQVLDTAAAVRRAEREVRRIQGQRKVVLHRGYCPTYNAAAW